MERPAEPLEEYLRKRQRSYLHIDGRVSAEDMVAYVSNPSAVARHAFYPFLHFVKTEERYSKSKGLRVKNRDLYYASHRDSFVFSRYAMLISECYESRLGQLGLADSVIAYRPLGRSNVDFALEAFRYITDVGNCVAYAFDIESFFDSLDHSILKSAWASIIGAENGRLPDDHFAVFKSLTRFAFVERNAIYSTFRIKPREGRYRVRFCSPAEFRERVRRAGLISVHRQPFGIPQGSPLSAILANVYMLPFDAAINRLVRAVGGLYRRYSDDILVVTPLESYQPIEALLRSSSQLLRLSINDAKTERSVFYRATDGRTVADRDLVYLGLRFTGQKTYLKNGTISRYYRKLRARIRHVNRAQDENPTRRKILRKQLYRQFTHIGGRNFYAYAKRASRLSGQDSIKKQVRKHWKHVKSGLKSL